MRYLEADAPLFMGNPYRFSGKERTLADYDFGARRYLPFRVPRWTSMDPMAEKYFSISPYAYCAGDPVNLVDPEGSILKIAPGSSFEFKNRVYQTILYMIKKGTASNINELVKSDFVYYIEENDDNMFIPSENTIKWNPYAVRVDDETGIQTSSVTILAHEAAHAARYDLARRTNTVNEHIENFVEAPDSQYDYVEERVVITTVEQNAARKHGEIKGNQITRNHHGGRMLRNGYLGKSIKAQIKAVRENNKVLYEHKENSINRFISKLASISRRAN